MSDLNQPKVSARQIQDLVGAELSSRSRFGYIALLLVSLSFAGLTTSLWLTEPSLPARTQAAFGFLVAINLCWAAFAYWVVTCKRVLLTGHKVIAGRMAVVFSATFVTFCIGLGLLGQLGRPAYLAAGFGLLMLGVAIALLLRSQHRFKELTDRRRFLAGQS